MVPHTIKILSQWAVDQRTLPMQGGAPTRAEIAVCWTRPVAHLTWAVARLTAPPTGVTVGLLWTLFNALTSWQGRAAHKEKWCYLTEYSSTPSVFQTIWKTQHGKAVAPNCFKTQGLLGGQIQPHNDIKHSHNTFWFASVSVMDVMA